MNEARGEMISAARAFRELPGLLREYAEPENAPEASGSGV